MDHLGTLALAGASLTTTVFFWQKNGLIARFPYRKRCLCFVPSSVAVLLLLRSRLFSVAPTLEVQSNNKYPSSHWSYIEKKDIHHHALSVAAISSTKNPSTYALSTAFQGFFAFFHL